MYLHLFLARFLHCLIHYSNDYKGCFFYRLIEHTHQVYLIQSLHPLRYPRDICTAKNSDMCVLYNSYRIELLFIFYVNCLELYIFL
jgi:hypothetical protein